MILINKSLIWHAYLQWLTNTLHVNYKQYLAIQNNQTYTFTCYYVIAPVVIIYQCYIKPKHEIDHGIRVYLHVPVYLAPFPKEIPKINTQ